MTLAYLTRCSHCHETTDAAPHMVVLCPQCGHQANAARLDCRCPRCKVYPAPTASSAMFDGEDARLEARVAEAMGKAESIPMSAVQSRLLALQMRTEAKDARETNRRQRFQALMEEAKLLTERLAAVLGRLDGIPVAFQDEDGHSCHGRIKIATGGNPASWPTSYTVAVKAESGWLVSFIVRPNMDANTVEITAETEEVLRVEGALLLALQRCEENFDDEIR